MQRRDKHSVQGQWLPCAETGEAETSHWKPSCTGMGHISAEQMAQRAFDLGLLDERQLQEIWAELAAATCR